MPLPLVHNLLRKSYDMFSSKASRLHMNYGIGHCSTMFHALSYTVLLLVRIEVYTIGVLFQGHLMQFLVSMELHYYSVNNDAHIGYFYTQMCTFFQTWQRYTEFLWGEHIGFACVLSCGFCDFWDLRRSQGVKPHKARQSKNKLGYIFMAAVNVYFAMFAI